MTGDGVNDAPSIKKQILVLPWVLQKQMFHKEAADMILTDNNFVIIVHAVKEGCVIYNNIRKMTPYSLSANIA